MTHLGGLTSRLKVVCFAAENPKEKKMTCHDFMKVALLGIPSYKLGFSLFPVTT